MTFKTIQDAFNYWNGHTVEEIEQRAAEIRKNIETNADVDMVAANVEIAGLAQAKANAGEKRSNNFNPITGGNMAGSAQAPAGDVFASAEYRSAYFKNLIGQEMTAAEKAAIDKAAGERRSDVFNTVSNSAAVLPTQTLNEIVKKAGTIGGVIGHCRAFNLPSKIAVPVMGATSAAAWHVEGAKVDSEKVEPVAVTFNAYEILRVFSMSTAVERTSISAFENYLIDELGASVMATIENALINGTGSGQGTGILTQAGTIPATYTKTGAKWQDIVNIAKSLKRGYANGAIWAMSANTLYTQIYGMIDGNERPMFIEDTQGDTVGRILGHEVVIDDNIPDDTIIYGNFRYMGYNMPGGIAVEKSTQSSFKNGLIDYRAITVADCKPIIAEAFVVATKAA